MKYLRTKYLLIPIILFIGSLFFAFLQPNNVSAQEQITEENRLQLSVFPNETSGLTDFRIYVSNFYLFSIGASILIAVMMMMIGGVIWLTSAGNPGRISTAKEYIINALIGVVLLLGAYTIIQAVNPKLVNLEDPNLPPIPSTGACLYNSEGKPRCKTDIEAYCIDTLNGQYKPKASCSDKSLCKKYNLSTFECEKNVTDGTLAGEEGSTCEDKVIQLDVTISQEEIDKANGTGLAGLFQSVIFDTTDPIDLAANRMTQSCVNFCRGLSTSEKTCTGTITGTASQGGNKYRSTCVCKFQ